MKRLLFLLPLSLLAGCSHERIATDEADMPPLAVPTTKVTPRNGKNHITPKPSAPKVKPTLQPDQVELSRLQPAQGHLAPGVLVYTKDGFLWGRVIKVEPDHVFPKGERGGVLFSDDDNSKEPPGYWPFKMFDNKCVLKN